MTHTTPVSGQVDLPGKPANKPKAGRPATKQPAAKRQQPAVSPTTGSSHLQPADNVAAHRLKVLLKKNCEGR